MRKTVLLLLVTNALCAQANEYKSVRLSPKIHTETTQAAVLSLNMVSKNATVVGFGEERLLGSEGSLLWLKFTQDAPAPGIYTVAYALTQAYANGPSLPTAQAQIEILPQAQVNTLIPVRILRAPREVRLNEVLQVQMPN